jgi:hypothetical protein
MVRRSSTSKAGVGNAAETSASKAATARSNKNDGTAVDQSRSSRPAVSGKSPASVGVKGPSGGLRSGSARKSTSGYSAPGHSGGMAKLGQAPKLGTSSAVSGTPSRTYGTTAAKNNSQAGASGAVSGKSTTYGTAPAKNRSHAEAYGTWEG